VRERWFGATGRRVPEIAVEGDPAVSLEEALVVDDLSDLDALRAAHLEGRPVVVRAGDATSVAAALARPEVSSVIVPADRPGLLELDLRRMTYG
jgi:hypothetical protein